MAKPYGVKAQVETKNQKITGARKAEKISAYLKRQERKKIKGKEINRGSVLE